VAVHIEADEDPGYVTANSTETEAQEAIGPLLSVLPPDAKITYHPSQGHLRQSMRCEQFAYAKACRCKGQEEICSVDTISSMGERASYAYTQYRRGSGCRKQQSSRKGCNAQFAPCTTHFDSCEEDGVVGQSSSLGVRTTPRSFRR
jgi:hypothetical protein